MKFPLLIQYTTETEPNITISVAPGFPVDTEGNDPETCKLNVCLHGLIVMMRSMEKHDGVNIATLLRKVISTLEAAMFDPHLVTQNSPCKEK